jgi:murein L,D-transpeptidase YafK
VAANNSDRYRTFVFITYAIIERLLTPYLFVMPPKLASQKFLAFARTAAAIAATATTVSLSTAAIAQTAPPIASIAFSNDVEAALVRALETLREGGIQAALKEMDLVLAKNPNFQLGHLIKGDLLMAKSGAPLAFTGTRAQPELVASLQQEARARLTRYFDGPPIGHLPTALIQLSPQQRHVLLMDSEKSRLYVFKNIDGAPQLITDFYISSGKKGAEKEREGDQKTPIGVYFVTSTMPKEKLSDFYGSGAFPLNFPNEWDKRLGKTGSGIWIHGTPPNTYSRPPRASDGCVVLTNEDFAAISKYVDPSITPIVIANRLEWKSPEQWVDTKNVFTDSLNRWQGDWESLNVDSYLAHYSPQFEADGKGLKDWAARKRGVGASKTFVKVEISNLSILEYPLPSTAAPLMMVTFDQTYQSNNASSQIKKRQYWQLENGQWKIIYEATAG